MGILQGQGIEPSIPIIVLKLLLFMSYARLLSS